MSLYKLVLLSTNQTSEKILTYILNVCKFEYLVWKIGLTI